MKKLGKFSLVVGLLVGLMTVAGAALASGPVHWTYEGEEGPEYWGELSPDFAACSTGMEQSPVNITADAPLNPAAIVFNYQPADLVVENNGHTVKITYPAGSSIEVEGKTYNLLQYHFHALSENTINGQHSAGEMHLVHQADDGEYAVVGVMMNKGAENAAYAPVWANLPATEGEAETIAGVSVNAADLLPADQSYYRFSGSFTTPPCTEGVKWFVLSAPVELSEAQMADFEALYDSNYRPVQPMNARTFMTADEVSVASETPAALPDTGGTPFPLATMLILTGVASIAAGVAVYRRNSA
jgi:carbonic anhydrase